MVAFDTGAPKLTATAEVIITVLRNINGPVFTPSIYRLTIDEDIPIGQYIQKLVVRDTDGVRTLVGAGCVSVLHFINYPKQFSQM